MQLRNGYKRGRIVIGLSGGVLKRVIYKPTDMLDHVVGWHARVFRRKVACARLATPPFTRRVINAVIFLLSKKMFTVF
jgi:hypothetical protein